MSKAKSKKQKLARVNKSLATLKEKFPELDLTDIAAYHAYMDYRLSQVNKREDIP